MSEIKHVLFLSILRALLLHYNNNFTELEEKTFLSKDYAREKT